MVSSAANLDESSDFQLSTLTDARVRSIASVPSKNSLIFADEARALIRSAWPNCADHEPLPSPEFDPACIAVNSQGTLLAVTGVDDPQIVFFNLHDPTVSPFMNYDNLANVIWLGFGPKCHILVSINQANILCALKPPDYNLLQEIELQVPTSGITWTGDTELIAADGSNRGVVRVFDFEHELEPVSLRIEAHRTAIAALSLSGDGLLATSDSSQRVVISRFSSDVFQTRRLPALALFDPDCAPIDAILWAGSNLCIAASDGYFHLWDQLQSAGHVKVPETPATHSESDKELESESSDSEDLRDTSKHVPLKHKHEPVIRRPKLRRREEDVEIPVRIGSSEFDEEEEEEEELTRPTFFPSDEAEEVSAGGSDVPRALIRPVPVDPTTKRWTAEEMFGKLMQKYGGEDESESSGGSESGSESVEAMKEREKEEHQLDKQFLAESDLSPDSDESADDAEAMDEMSDVTESEHEEVAGQFMPSSTSEFINRRRFLCWNLIGCIFLRENPATEETDETTSIDIEFADTIRHRNQFFDNRHRFTLGALGQTGVALASRSFVQFIQHDPWAPDSETTLRFPDDETVDLIACGSGWFAVATERQFLRIFGSSGLELAVLSLPARPMTMVGGDSSLAIVFSDQLLLTYRLYNVRRRRVVGEGGIPARAPLKWIGFDSGLLYVVGSDFVVLVLVQRFGLQWIPVCEMRPRFPEGATDFFCVGVNDRRIWGVYLTADQPTPLTVAHQKLRDFQCEALAIDHNYRPYLTRRLEYFGYEKGEKKERAMFKADKKLLKLFQAAVAQDRTDIAGQLGVRVLSKKARVFFLQCARPHPELFAFLENAYREREENEEEEERPEPQVQNASETQVQEVPEPPPHANTEDVASDTEDDKAKGEEESDSDEVDEDSIE
jgi:WD40 repeat protein